MLYYFIFILFVSNFSTFKLLNVLIFFFYISDAPDLIEAVKEAGLTLKFIVVAQAHS